MPKKHILAIHLGDYLKEKYGSARDLADAVGISTQYAYNLLSGKNYPSTDLLMKLNIFAKYEVEK